jgi:hypothetical protein
MVALFFGVSNYRALKGPPFKASPKLSKIKKYL